MTGAEIRKTGEELGDALNRNNHEQVVHLGIQLVVEFIAQIADFNEQVGKGRLSPIVVEKSR